MKSHKLYAIFVLLIVVVLLGLSNSNIIGKTKQTSNHSSSEVMNENLQVK